MADKKIGVFRRAWKSPGAAWSAAVVIGIVLVLTLALIVWNAVDTSKPKNNAPGPVAVATQTTVPSGISASPQPKGCQVPVGDKSLRPALPKDLRWEAANGGTWPVSDTYGPTNQEKGFGVCFARSPLGAALAAASFWSAQYTGHTGKDAIREYAMDSAGKTTLLDKPGEGDSATIPAAPYPLIGFTVDAFAPDEAIITTVFSTSNSQTGFVGVPVTLNWVNGDWKLRVSADGTYTVAKSATTPVDGQFVAWRGK